MNKSALVTLTVAALSVSAAPLALAQNAPVENNGHGYLSTRVSMDQPAAINRIYAGVEAQKHAGGLNAEGPDYLAERKGIDGPEHIQAIYKQVADNGALQGTDLSPAQDYLSDRERIDWPDHINALVGRTLEEVGQL